MTANDDVAPYLDGLSETIIVLVAVFVEDSVQRGLWIADGVDVDSGTDDDAWAEYNWRSIRGVMMGKSQRARQTWRGVEDDYIEIDEKVAIGLDVGSLSATVIGNLSFKPLTHVKTSETYDLTPKAIANRYDRLWTDTQHTLDYLPPVRLVEFAMESSELEETLCLAFEDIWV